MPPACNVVSQHRQPPPTALIPQHHCGHHHYWCPVKCTVAIKWIPYHLFLYITGSKYEDGWILLAGQVEAMCLCVMHHPPERYVPSESQEDVSTINHSVLCIVQVLSFLLLSSIPQHGYATICLYFKISLSSSSSHMFSFGSFIALVLTFKFMIHSLRTILCGMKYVLEFFSSTYISS